MAVTLAAKRPMTISRDRAFRLGLFLIWLAAALWLASVHVMWRDEVRAFSFALSGDTPWSMLRILHGEGHPGLWYLILRGTHALVPSPLALPIAAFMVGAAAAFLFAMRAPFSLGFLALALFGRFALYEYTVMARNYGISMLILFAFAALYRRHRDRGWIPGGLLLLLANCNVHSVLLAAALLLFWLIDVAGDDPERRLRALPGFVIGVGLGAVGALACALELYPPVHDAVVAQESEHSAFIAPFRVGALFGDLIPERLGGLHRSLVPILLIGVLVPLARRPGALAAGLVGTLGLSSIFAFIYRGEYRHVGLLLPFLLTLLWLVAEGQGGRWPDRMRWSGRRWLKTFGGAAWVALLSLQVAQSAVFVDRAARGMPESRSRELAELLRRPALRRAIVIADPDYRAEALPYYVDNPIYLVREQRFARWAVFSRRAQRMVSLDLFLDTALRLHRATGRPVLLAMSEPRFRAGAPDFIDRPNFGDDYISAAALARLRASSLMIADFAPLEGGDESFAVYAVGMGTPGEPLAAAR